MTLGFLAPCLFLSGCSSSNSGATVTTVSVTSSVAGGVLILSQSTTLTATVVGPTDTTVKWVGCTYTTSTTDSTGKVTTKPAVACPTDGTLGTLSNEQATGTATFTAPSTLPDPTTFSGLTVIITVQAVADSSKHGTGTVNLFIDSGITVTLTPSSAAVPTNEQQPFFAVLTNDLKTQGVTWLVTQSTPTAAASSSDPHPFRSLATCTVSGNATGCGSIDANGVYTAPAVVPTASTPSGASTTPTIVTVVSTSVKDPTRFALATITITPCGTVTFNGISPTIAPQGGAYWDIYLDAPNISSASIITLTDANNGRTTLTSTSGQIKVLFPIPTATVPSPPSTGARVRLFAANLARADANPVTISVTDPGQPVTTTPGG